MSAGFKIDEEVFWGTNGAIEAYVSQIGATAARLFGPRDALATFFQQQLEGFFPGIVVVLDDHLAGPEACRRFLGALDESTSQLLHDGTFTALGREWVETVMARLHEKVAKLSEL